MSRTALAPAAASTRSDDPAPRPLPALGIGAMLAVWAAAAVPMGALAWLVAPALADPADALAFAPVLIGCLTAGLAWQTLLVVALVGIEQRTLRWRVVREALWLNAPQLRSGRRGGRAWLVVIPFAVGFGLLQLLPINPPPASGHEFGALLATEAGRAVFSGDWPLYGLVLLMLVLNTVLGEELLFHGYLLPRMRRFGRFDWVVNGILFALYHLHQPWSMPRVLVAGTVLMGYPVCRFRSAWLGIIVHSTQALIPAVLLLALVLS